jgi:hypothetical protein
VVYFSTAASRRLRGGTWSIIAPPHIGRPVFFRDLGQGESQAANAAAVALSGLPEGVGEGPVFAMCAASAGAVKIVTAGAGKIWSASISGGVAGAWQPVGDAVHPLYLHAFSPRGRTCWAEWLEKDVGLRRAPLR